MVPTDTQALHVDAASQGTSDTCGFRKCIQGLTQSGTCVIWCKYTTKGCACQGHTCNKFSSWRCVGEFQLHREDAAFSLGCHMFGLVLGDVQSVTAMQWWALHNCEGGKHRRKSHVKFIKHVTCAWSICRAVQLLCCTHTACRSLGPVDVTLQVVAGCSDPSYETITAMLASSPGAHSPTLAPATDPQPAWSTYAPVHSNSNFQKSLLEEASHSQVSSGWQAETDLEQRYLGSDAASQDSASLLGDTAHSQACPSRLGLHSDTSSSHTSSRSSQGSSHSRSSSSSVRLWSADLHRASPRAFGQPTEPHKAPEASELSQAAAATGQGAREPTALSAELPDELMPSPPDSASSQHGERNRQMLSTAQQVYLNGLMPPVGGATAASGQPVSVHQSSAGSQKQLTGSAVQRAEHHCQQDAQRQCSADSHPPSEDSAGTAVEFPAAPPAQVDSPQTCPVSHQAACTRLGGFGRHVLALVLPMDSHDRGAVSAARMPLSNCLQQILNCMLIWLH